MVNGTSPDMNLNETAAILARNRGFTLSHVFSVAGRGMVELIGESASELWDVGQYRVNTTRNTTRLVQETDGPFLVAAYPGRLPRGSDGHWQARKLLNASGRV